MFGGLMTFQYAAVMLALCHLECVARAAGSEEVTVLLWWAARGCLWNCSAYMFIILYWKSLHLKMFKGLKTVLKKF